MKEIIVGGKSVLVDEDHYPVVSMHNWRLYSVFGREYAVAKIGGFFVPMHRLLCRSEPPMVVDHIDGNSLNNTSANLRACLRAQNQQNRGVFSNNRSGFKGVYRDYRRENIRWRAEINAHGKRYRLGSYDSPEDAAKAYDAAAKVHHGEYARLNFPDQ